MESFGLIWVGGFIISLALLIKDMWNRRDMGPSTKAWWVFVVLVLNIFGFVLYLLVTRDFPRRGKK